MGMICRRIGRPQMAFVVIQADDNGNSEGVQSNVKYFKIKLGLLLEY